MVAFTYFHFKRQASFLHQIGIPTYQINRILAWLNPVWLRSNHLLSNRAQGQIAIGSGGLWGQGFNVSNLLVPVHWKWYDFYCHCRRFWSCRLQRLWLLLYLLLIYRMLKLRWNQIINFTPIFLLVLSWCYSFIFLKISEQWTGILPLTGIPLPFISQGGSSIISNLIGVGLLLSISYQNNLSDEKVHYP